MSPARTHHDRIRTPRALALAGFVALAAALAGCGVNDVRVTVANESGATLDSLRVLGEKGATRVRTLGPGESATVGVAVAGEDALGLRGRVGGRSLVPAMPVYAEAGYRVRLTVDSSGVVRAESKAGY